jgi:hypothetical protein
MKALSLLRRLVSLLVAGLIAGLAGCASSTSLVTGERHPPLPAAAVKVYLDAPPQSDVIGLVRAHSVLGLGEQGHLDAALAALRAEAGKLGANGVVIVSTGDRPLAFVGAGGRAGAFGLPVDTPNLEGRAIFVRSP